MVRGLGMSEKLSLKGTPIEAAMNTLVEAAVVRAKDIDQGYFFENEFYHYDRLIGRFRIIVQRTDRP